MHKKRNYKLSELGFFINFGLLKFFAINAVVKNRINHLNDIAASI